MAKPCEWRAIVQLFLTGITLSTAVVAFAFAYVFENYVEMMSENFTGDPKSDNLPCIRSTFSADCDNAREDKCWDYCCPAGYRCARDPIVGLYCQDQTVCGDPEWCKYFADIPGTCRTHMCKDYEMVRRVTKMCYILAAVGIVLDLMDIIAIIMLPDLVVCKAGTNILASLMKWIAFGLILGAETDTFLDTLSKAQCYNQTGQQMVQDSKSMFLCYVITQVVSASLSIVLAPFSAYYGGKLSGVPYVK
mmetsp:Transcript_111348/g.175457  ORF Transcript_111348/g.175457 Transcript_111348/m.175457 type:complete len:248 (-) Transcript_111348:39-782(-)